MICFSPLSSAEFPRTRINGPWGAAPMGQTAHGVFQRSFSSWVIYVVLEFALCIVADSDHGSMLMRGRQPPSSIGSRKVVRDASSHVRAPTTGMLMTWPRLASQVCETGQKQRRPSTQGPDALPPTAVLPSVMRHCKPSCLRKHAAH